jgi:hypothetical protein
MWLTPTTPIHFRFGSARVPPVDRAWIDRLVASATSPRGLIVTTAEGLLIAPLASRPGR